MSPIPLRPTLLPPSDAPLAYRVPWSVDRSGPHPVVANTGDETLRFVRALIGDGSGHASQERWGSIAAGETSEVCLCDLDRSDCFVTLAWFRDGGEDEYLWRFVL